MNEDMDISQGGRYSPYYNDQTAENKDVTVFILT